MLNATKPKKTISPVVKLDNIPPALAALPHWCVWRADVKLHDNKLSKVPYNTGLTFGLSTGQPHQWGTFDKAAEVYTSRRPTSDAPLTVESPSKPGEAAGIGILMRAGLVGIDLDGCVVNGTLTAWAQVIVDLAASYTELSPSGQGIRIFVWGSVADFTNGMAGPDGEGIEVYQGDASRFLTVTGNKLPEAPAEVSQASEELLTHLETYRVKKPAADDSDAAGEVPMLLPPDQLPSLDGMSQNSLELPEVDRTWLMDGTLPDGVTDNSRMLARATASILATGTSKEATFSLLANNDVAFGVALGHREHKQEKALLYLWKNHVCAVKVAVAEDSDFECLAPLSPAEEVEQAAIREANKAIDAARKGTEKGAKKPATFTLETVDEYCARVRPMEFDIPGLCPRGEMIFIGGPSGGGKTHFALHMVAALVGEGRMFGRQAQRKARVAWACLEGASGFRSRLLGYRKHYGTSLDGLLMIKEPVTLLEPESVKNLIKSLRAAGGVDYVVVDTWSKATPGADENSSVDMGLAVDLCLKVHRALGCTVIAVAHVGKDSTKGLRGWSGLKGAADAEIMVEKFTTRGEQTAHRAMVTKLKDGQGEGDTFHFEVEPVILPASDGGNAGVLSELCNILPTPRIAPKKWSAGVNQLAVQRAIEAEAARRRDNNDPRVLIDTKQLIDAATKERMRMAAADGKNMTTKTARDGVRDAVNALRDEGKLHPRGERVEVKGLDTIQSDPYESPSLAVDDEASSGTGAAPEEGNSHPGGGAAPTASIDEGVDLL